jgi:hypothetical protein
MTYTESEKILLISWKEKASGWRWLHYHSMHHYKNINSNFVYSSIVLSTLAGAGGFSTAGSDSSRDTVMGTIQFYMGYVIGATNVIIGLINSFQRFGKAAEKTELHASAAMQYAMLYRLIETELNLSENHQRDELVMTVRQEMDRLLAQSPAIPQKLVDEFNKKFPDVKDRPDVCNGLASVSGKSLPSEMLDMVISVTPKRYQRQSNSFFVPPSSISLVPRDTV